MIFLLLILGYGFIGGMISGFISKSEFIAKYVDDIDIFAIIIGITWPILFAVIPISLVVYSGYKISIFINK